MFIGKIVAITGGASGIGQAFANKFLKLGAKVWVFDINDKNLKQLVHECEQNGEPPSTFCGDVCKEKDIKDFIDTIIKQDGAIDYWINNAGISGIASIKSSNYNKIIDINFKAVIQATQIVIEKMQQRGFGHIINVASVAGYVPAPFMTGYNATKFGIIGFTRSLQAELEITESPVKAHILSPGFVKTPMIKHEGNESFPAWLDFALTTPEKVAEDLVRLLHKDKSEVISSWNGKLMNFLYKVTPKQTVKSSRALMSKSPKAFITGSIDFPE